MADYVPTWIEIGGKVPRQLVQGLIDCIDGDVLRHDFGGEKFAATDADELLSCTVDADGNAGTLKLHDERAHNGEFAEIEHFLEDNRIAFDRHSEAGDEFSAEIVRFRPGWPAPTTTLTDGIGREVVGIEYLAEALQMLRAGQVDNAIAQLSALANENVSPLTPLEIMA